MGLLGKSYNNYALINAERAFISIQTRNKLTWTEIQTLEHCTMSKRDAAVVHNKSSA